MRAPIGPLRLATTVLTFALVACSTAQETSREAKLRLLNGRSLTNARIFLLSDTYRSSAHFTTRSKSIDLRRSERPSKTTGWFSFERRENVSFRITDAEAIRGGEDLFVAGVDGEGTCLIEHWHVPPRTNGWALTDNLPPAYPGIGNPAPTFSQSLFVWGEAGATWQDPESNKIESPNRSLLVKQESGGPFIELEADPQGRYLLFHDVGSHERKMTLLADGTTVVVATQSGAEALAELASMDLVDVEGVGRVCILRRVPRETATSFIDVITVGIDAANDGVFDAWHDLDESAWLSSPFAERHNRVEFHRL